VSTTSNGGASYYGQPILKEPVWTWEIPMYFFTGGVGGASAGLAYLAELRGNGELARRTWAAALAAAAVNPALLTSDLGKPTRFLNMLRMFKLTSPMSVGSWILAGSGASTAVAAIDAWTGAFPRGGKLARPGAALLGLPLSTYTGALIANTAIPAWHESRRLLPFVFGSGAGLSAGAVALMLTPPEHAAAARRLAVAGTAVEVVLKRRMEEQLGPLGEPYKKGAAAMFGHIGAACLIGGATLIAARASSSRLAARAGGALLSAGALAARWSVFKAGFQSAADPRYVVQPQRGAIVRGERRGASRVESRRTAGNGRLGSPATTLES